MASYNYLMKWFGNFSGTSKSTFVTEEVLKNLPKTVTIKFASEFDKDDETVIFICSPDHEGLISSARTNKEAISNAQDAILTYFDIPRECAQLIEFEVTNISQSSLDLEGQDSIRIREFKVKELTHA